jgi:hypothetical protein
MRNESFGPLVPPSLQPSQIFSLDGVADLNGDGKADLIITYSGGSTHPVSRDVVLGNGDGTFGSTINVPNTGVPPPAIVPSMLVIADMNGDGRLDLVFPWQSGINGVVVLVNTSAPGFTLSASALSPTSIAAGSSAASTVTVSPMPGFTSAVALSCVGLPSGASCQFAPASVPNGSNSSQLTITTTTSAAAGTYPIEIQGSTGALTSIATLSLTLAVPPPTPDFTLSAGSTQTATVSPGATATYTLSLAPQAGFNQSVALTCSGAPSHSACSVSPNMVFLNGTAAVTATVSVATMASSVLPLPTAMRGHRLTNYWPPLLQLLSLFLRRRRAAMRWVPALSLAAVIGTAMAMACGGGGSSTKPTGGVATASGTYTITVTGTAGSGSTAVSHTTNLTLIVQ